MEQKNYETSSNGEENRNLGKEIEQELDLKLRRFGDTLSDAVKHGFEGRGQELGDRAWDVGRAVVDGLNYGIGEVGRRMEQSRSGSTAPNGRPGQTNPVGNFADMWKKPEPKLSKKEQFCQGLRKRAKLFYSAGLAMTILGGIFAMGLLTIGIFMCLESGSAVGGSAAAALTIMGSFATLGGLLCGWGAGNGVQKIKDSYTLAGIANAAEAASYASSIPVELLAQLMQTPAKKLRKALRRWVKKNDAPVWLDGNAETLYFSAEDLRAALTGSGQAQSIRPDPAAVPEEKKAKEKETASRKNAEPPTQLEAARRFAVILEQEKQRMEDPLAAEELEHMQQTTRNICAWLEQHPESLPQTRRFAEYYIPTTLKLLNTYHGVQGQQGENAESIRRDIGGILHTLNAAFDNLYDRLLSDTALDVSSEIAALQGMLANDGLTEGGLR